MPFPISVNVGDGSAAAVAVSSAAIALVFLLRPIIQKVQRPEDLRFFGVCALIGVVAVLVTGAVCTLPAVLHKEEKQRIAQTTAPTPGVPQRDLNDEYGDRLAQLTKRDCEELKTKLRASRGGAIDPQEQAALKACTNGREAKPPAGSRT